MTELRARNERVEAFLFMVDHNLQHAPVGQPITIDIIDGPILPLGDLVH